MATRKVAWRLTLVLVMVVAVGIALEAPSAAQGSRKLALEMYFDLESVSDPQLSPDGTQIVYTRGWIDKVNDRRESAIWVMNSDGSKNRFLVNGSSPRWSPDGSRIAYLGRGEPRGSQIFVRWMDAEGAVTQVTRVDRSPQNIAWSPDGRSIAFTMLVPSRDTWNIRMPSRPEGARWTEAPRIIERLVYRRDRVGFLEEGYQHIFLVPADAGTARQLTSGNFNHGGSFSWTPDGKEIVFSSLREEDWEYQWRESEIYAVNVADGSVRQLTKRKGPDTNPEVSPDGRWVAYTGYDWTDDTFIESTLYVMGIDGSNFRALTAELDRSPADLQWAADSSGVYFNVNDRGSRNLYFAPLRGTVRQVTQGTHILNVSSISRDGRAVGTRTSFHDPGQVVTFSVSRPEIRSLTSINESLLAGVKLGEVEELWYDSVENFRIQGWLIKPPDFDPGKKYPLILTIHGGPHAMYGVGFNFSWQQHAAEGYLVLYTNPRGSSGYGSAFGNAIKNAYPSMDYDDLMAGVDQVVGKRIVDESRMYVYGCSGGGVLTAWIIGHTDRFAAASVNCPVINWLSFVGTTDGVSWYRNFKNLPWDDPSEHLRRSPLMYVGNVTTPTMLMTGVDDLRTPISQTEEYYQALRYRKIPTAMLRFNGEYHGTTSKPSNFLRTQLYLHHWFGKYRREGGKAVKAEGSGEMEATAAYGNP